MARNINLGRLFLARLRGGEPFTVQEALRIIASLCGRLHAGHVKKNDDGTLIGYVHGALSLRSVWVAADGQVHLAEMASRESEDWAPERIAGQPPTVASDIYECGVLLHVLLTGGGPYDRDTPEESAEARRAGELSLHENSHHFPSEVIALLTRALEREPEARFPTAKAMQAAIERLFDEPGWAITVADIAQLVERALAAAGSEQKAERVRYGAGDVDCRALPDEDAPPASHSSMAQRVFNEVEALGFSRIGVKVEIAKRTGFRVPSVEFSSAEHRAFASIFFTRDAAPMLFFQTDFDDGSLVLTGAYHRDSHRKPRAVLTGQPNQSLAKVLEAHRAEVEAFVAAGRSIREGWDLDARVRSSLAFFENEDRH
ncbi:MAG: hypothetical protein QM723_10195 [Myxococcaceae bacterium]